MKTNVIGIYGIVDDKTGKIYCGQSSDIARRWSNHSSFLKNGEHSYKELQEAYDKDKNRIKYTILEKCTEEELKEREDWWIKHIERIDGWTLINKQKHGGNHNIKVKDTSKMCIAQRGENNPRCRLKEEDIRQIKMLIEKGISIKQIAKQYCISTSFLYNIKSGRKWKHVQI
ncbi:GIY-YIG nuclease family protein [Hathewaya histolytica]|uniref:GIY-YIG domain-containing protein n=1 Tax=Hathewaya histolytica TaxID=1498 RepID=A0A4V6KED1_HATHI|nr:GIY-YIG nuclease family protein [Hathewaya histolytica]VTQ86887.1 GIY-YIG domain-containing protein [Hathewaya histolytica]